MSYQQDNRKNGPSLLKIGFLGALAVGIYKLANDDELRGKVGQVIGEGATKLVNWIDEKTAPQPQRVLAGSFSDDDEARKREIRKLDLKRGEILQQQKLLLARREEMLNIRRKAIQYHQWKQAELGRKLLKRGVKSIVRHLVFHALGSFAGTALATKMDAVDSVGIAHDVADASDAADAIASAMEALPDFDAFDTMQVTWEQLGDMDLIDVDDVDFFDPSDIQNSYDDMNDTLESLQTCNQGFVDVANQNYTTFSQYGDMDVFQDSHNSDVHFGSGDSRFDTPLKGPNGEALTCTAGGHYLIKDTGVEVPYTQTKY